MNNKLIVLLSCILLALCTNVSTQTAGIYRKYYLSRFIINPAMSGYNFYPDIKTAYQKQWFGTNNAPYTAFLSGHLRLSGYSTYNSRMMLNKTKMFERGRIGLGGLLLYEENGPLKNINSSFSYAYYIPFRRSELSFGLSAKFISFILDETGFTPINRNDGAIQYKLTKKQAFDADAGVYYHTPQFYAGLSLCDLLKAEHKLSDDINLSNKRDFFILSGYKFFLPAFEYEPSVSMGIFDYTEPLVFITNKFYYHNFNWFSVTYKTYKALMFSLAYKYKKLQCGYTYEYNMGNYQNNYSASHEVWFGYNLALNASEGIQKIAK